ncbi:MAG: hypothetical protein QM723_33685 [Myxococcaceae bacterium]
MLPALLTILAVAPLDVAGCKAGKTETGSLHAATSFETQLTKPKSKLKQLLDCGGAPVTLYVLELDSEKGAREAANLTGPMLWGGLAPTGEHDDELMLKGALMVVVSGPAMPVAGSKLQAMGFKPWRGEEASKGEVIERLSKELDCSATSKDLNRAWCPATLTKAAAFTAPKGKGVLLGISAPFPASKSLAAGMQGTRVSVLAYDGNALWLSDVSPENDGEAKQLAEVVAGIAGVLKADAKSIAVPKDSERLPPVAARQGEAEGRRGGEHQGRPGGVRVQVPRAGVEGEVARARLLRGERRRSRRAVDLGVPGGSAPGEVTRWICCCSWSSWAWC